MFTTYPSITQFQQLVELKDYRPPTKKEYVRCLRKLAEHYQNDPATLTQDQVRAYFLFLRQDKQCSGSALSIIKAALQLFFREQLRRTDWTVFGELVIRRGQPLPLVLSRPEVQRVLGCLREPRFRTCLRLIYHTGLRVGSPREISQEERTLLPTGGLSHGAKPCGSKSPILTGRACACTCATARGTRIAACP